MFTSRRKRSMCGDILFINRELHFILAKKHLRDEFAVEFTAYRSVADPLLSSLAGPFKGKAADQAACSSPRSRLPGTHSGRISTHTPSHRRYLIPYSYSANTNASVTENNRSLMPHRYADDSRL